MLKATLITLVIVFSTSLKAGECRGHVVFFSLEKHHAEIEEDFNYYFGKVRSVFEEKNISTSIHTSFPIDSNTCFGRNVSVPLGKTELSLGYVFLKPNMEMKVFGGVMTDFDLVSEANDFFI